MCALDDCGDPTKARHHRRASSAQPPTGPASPGIEIAANGHPTTTHPPTPPLSTPSDDLQRRHVGPRRPADPSSGRKLLRYILVGRAGRGRWWPAVLPPFGPPLVTPMPPNHVPCLSPTRASSRHLRLTPTTTRLEVAHEVYSTYTVERGWNERILCRQDLLPK